MQGLEIISSSYGHHGDEARSAYDLARMAGHTIQDHERSLKELLNDHSCPVFQNGTGVSPELGRKPGFVRAGQPGHRGPYATGPKPSSVGHWWGDASHSTPKQDIRYRKRK